MWKGDWVDVLDNKFRMLRRCRNWSENTCLERQPYLGSGVGGWWLLFQFSNGNYWQIIFLCDICPIRCDWPYAGGLTFSLSFHHHDLHLDFLGNPRNGKGISKEKVIRKRERLALEAGVWLQKAYCLSSSALIKYLTGKKNPPWRPEPAKWQNHSTDNAMMQYQS